MAYIAATARTLSEVAASSLAARLPEHLENDLLVACVTQDGGGTTIACSGWTLVGTQSAKQGQRTVVLYKVAGSSESNPTFTGANDDWIATVIAIRGAASSAFINAYGESDGTASLASPSVTSTTDGCLLLYVCGWDHTGQTATPGPLGVVSYASNFCSQIVGYLGQESAGATPTITFYDGIAGEGGSCIVIAIKPETATEFPPYLSQIGEKVSLYGAWAIASEGLSWGNLNTGITTSINGIGVNATQTAISGAQFVSGVWSYFLGLGSAEVTAGEWVGAYHTASLDMTGKLFCVKSAWTFIQTRHGAEGWIVVFADSSGSWAAFQLTNKAAATYGTAETYIIDVENVTPYDSVGTIDWSDITKVGYAHHRISAVALASYTNIQHAYLIDKMIGVGGYADYPLVPATWDRFTSGMDITGIATKQASAQLFVRAPMQIGDGSTTTVFSFFGSSVELPTAWNAYANPKWDVGPLSVAICIYASANDVIDFSSGALISQTKQLFELHASSSTAADYNFNGFSAIGYAVTWRSGITCNGAIFADCYKITAHSGTFDGCTISGCVDDVALVTADPAEITDCTFVSGGSGHAIELTTPGAFAFSGNTFSGYGADGTADAAIYNNSGGAITLNIAGGGDTPTVRNGAGSSTTVSNAVVITIENVVSGSRYRVEKVSDSSLIGEGVASGSDITISTPYGGTPFSARIKVRKASGTPFYKPYNTLTTVGSSGAKVYVGQQLDE